MRHPVFYGKIFYIQNRGTDEKINNFNDNDFRCLGKFDVSARLKQSLL